MSRVDDHIITLVRANEGLEGFSEGMLVYALKKYHDEADIIRGLNRLTTQGKLLREGEQIVFGDEDE